jgi:phosphate transport system substrate-binding protein
MIVLLSTIFLISCNDSQSTISESAISVNGAGATFPYPVYSAWANQYKSETSIQINYQAIGSGGGIRQIQENTVTFGATDMPLSKEDLQKYGLYQFPTTIGGVVPIINIPGINSCDIVLTGDILAKIYMGEITNWNDPYIAGINLGKQFPDLPIIPVHRSDGSGTTYILAEYLSKTNETWKNEIGVSNALNWKVGVGGKGNDGIAAAVFQISGSIGYVEYAFSANTDVPYACMINKSGSTVMPSVETFSAAAQNAQWISEEGYSTSLTDQLGSDVWPMTSTTYILVYRNSFASDDVAEALKFFEWAFDNGDSEANRLHYVPLPVNVEKEIISDWH